MQKDELTEYAHVLCEKYELNQMYTLPLISSGKLEGVLQILVCQDKVLSSEDRGILDIVSEHIATGMAKIRAEEALRELARRDCLTALYNHQYFWKKLEEQKSRDERYGEAYSVIYIDIDNFKHFNDTYGHLEGDKVLRVMGDILTASLRRADSAYRYGGEEFVVLLPHTYKQQATVLAHRIKDEVYRKLYLKYEITVSIGVADSSTGKDTVRTADRAMYEAKRKGKNRIKVL